MYSTATFILSHVVLIDFKASNSSINTNLNSATGSILDFPLSSQYKSFTSS